ncbi:MAG: hypothetical protein IKE93_07395 [Erysipelotrichaceae bacterium]|nr:hypothetical protein [Erysipelotrichaceae bacterium]
MNTFFSLIQTALELGLITSLTVMALFLSYSMLNVCDLSTDSCFTLGACTGAVVALAYPAISLPAAMLAGALSGVLTALLQTRMGINSLLSGIIVNTGMYSVNIAILGNASLININKANTPFTFMKSMLSRTPLAGYYRLIVIIIAVALVALFLTVFLKLRLGLAIRATGDNPQMVNSSSINPAFTTTVALCISGSITALSGALMAQYQKTANIDIGQGILTVALASLLIGNSLTRSSKISFRLLAAVIGAFIFRLVYTIALKMNMPAYMLKLVSSVIVIIAISGPYLHNQLPLIRRRISYNQEVK